MVLLVPEFAAERALAHAAGQRGWLLAGAPLDEDGASSARVVGAARVLLRTASPLLAEDVSADGRRPRPSERVPASAGGLPLAVEGELSGAQWIWIPDDIAEGPAGQELRELVEPYPPRGVMRLIVETGTRDDAALQVLYGTFEAWDRGRWLLSFTAAQTRHRLCVPVHRIVGLTGDRNRRSSSTLLWETYTPPAAHEYCW